MTGTALASTRSYEYDTLGRVVKYTDTQGRIVTYSYDKAGNRTAMNASAPAPPVAVADSISTSPGVAKTFDPRANDSDINGDALTITAVGLAAHGAVSFTATSLTYTPAAGYVGADSFTYTLSDGNGGAATATVSVSVINRAPSAVDDATTTVQNTAVSYDPRINDSDPDGDALSVSAVGLASHGVATYTAASVTYTPAAGYVGPDSFNYTVSDGKGGTASATLSVMVNNRVPVAVADAISTNLNTAATFNPRTNDSDPDGDVLTISAVTNGAHGTVINNSGASVTYTPATGYVGADSFSYTISDGKGGTATATVSVLVNNRWPTPANDATSTVQNTAVTLNPLTNDSDPDGDTLSVSAVGTAAHGATAYTATSVTYTPTAGYVGTDSFSYTVSDGKGGAASATVSVTVNNRIPVAAADTISTNQNTAVTFNPRVNDSDPDGDALTISAVGAAAHGSVVNNGTSITYTPAAGYVGPDSFSYTVSDGKGGAASATVSATVNNRVPTAGADAISTSQNIAATFDPRANDSDPDGDTLTISAVGAAAHGTVVNNGGASVTYTPAAGYVGADSFSYTISDGKGGTASTTVSVTVNNRVPAAGADTIATNQNIPVTFDPRGNDSDPDGDALTISAVGAAAHGTVVNNGGASMTYTPAAGYVGADSFSYTISDGKGGTASATVSVTVSNRVPAAGADAIATNQNTAVTFDPRGNDSDPDGDGLSISAVGAAAHGAVVNNGAAITYTPSAGYVGADSFSYTISDGKGGTASATVSVTVNNRVPTAGADSVSTNAGTALTFDPRGNDSDPDGDALTISAVGAAAHGGVVNNGTSITYTPTGAYVGPDSFTYAISDGKGGAASATVSVTVNNRPPIARPDTGTAHSMAGVVISPLVNDSDPDGDPITITSFTGTNIASEDASIVGGGTQISFSAPFATASKHKIVVITYTISDGRGGTATSTYTIDVGA